MVNQNLDYAFNPSSIAVVGVSSKAAATALGGGLFIQHLLQAGYGGRIYPINPKGGVVSGLEMFKNVNDVPEPVDYAIICVSAELTLKVMEDCIKKGVKVVHIYSAGFSEFGTDEGRRLEAEISSMAKKSGTRVIGPNCIGVYCPKTGLAFDNDVSRESGTIAFVSQSGGNATTLIRESAIRGARFSKVVSYGNGCDVNESDLLEYLSCDPDTEVILLYVEGVKDGKRFFQTLKEATKIKPVIVLKGGVGEAGTRAAVSHTGALAGSPQVWEALFRQLRIIQVYNLEELIDIAVTFTYLPRLSGRRIAILTAGGGISVLSTDICSRVGLKVPRFPPETQKKLASYSTRDGVGLMLGNPVDLSGEIWTMAYDCTKTMLHCEEIDLLIYLLPISTYRNYFSGIYRGIISATENVIKAHKDTGKPLAAVIPEPISDQTYQVTKECTEKFIQAGVPCYRSLANATRAIVRFLDHQEYAVGMTE